MNRYSHRILIVIVILAGIAESKALRATEQTDNTQSITSIRTRTLYQSDEPMPDEFRWKREIYRQLDMEKEEKNMPLYFPSEPTNGQKNLFATLFEPLCDQKLIVYEYLDGEEIFTDSTRIKIKDILDKFHILYKERGRGRLTTYAVDNSDVPSAEVKSYYVKELYYFDHRTSEYRVEVEAICPILHREGEFGGDVVKYPMFWVKYNDLRPFLFQTWIMASNLNNAATCTIDDYISRRLYKGDIYKTTNLRNLTLMQYCPTPDSLEREQKRIELQLTAFEKRLWGDSLTDDSIKTIQRADAQKSTRATRGSRKRH